MEVKLETLVGMAASPVGEVEVEHNIWRVMVYDENLKYAPLRIPACKLHVGYIGKQPGANFCPIPELERFQPPQREFIVAEAKRLHGDADKRPHVDLVKVPDDGDE